MNFKLERKNIVCLYPWLTDSTAIKCTGQICETIAVKHNLNSYIVTYNNEEYNRFKKYCPNTRLIFLKGKLNFRGWTVFKDLCCFILFNSRKIDILYLYHFPEDEFAIPFIGNLYKFINKHGVLYIRLEADIDTLPQTFPGNIKKGIKNMIKKSIVTKFYRNIDLLGVIDNPDFYLSRKLRLWQLSAGKIRVQLNGYRIYEPIQIKPLVEKDNCIVLAGRLNSFQKGFDIFLEALKSTDLKNWKVILMGEIAPEQIEQIKRIENDYSFSKGKITILGHISDVAAYLQVLNDAKIFCLPSRFDGIPLVIPDAMSMGCVIIGSDLFGIKEIATNNGECGLLFPEWNPDKLASLLNKVISGEMDLEAISVKAKNRAEILFHWDTIVEGLAIPSLLN